MLKTSRIHYARARRRGNGAAHSVKRPKTIYRALGRSGFARVDLFLTPSGELVFNEVNTIPGSPRTAASQHDERDRPVVSAEMTTGRWGCTYEHPGRRSSTIRANDLRASGGSTGGSNRQSPAFAGTC